MHEAAAAINTAILFVATMLVRIVPLQGHVPLQFEHVFLLAEVAKAGIPRASILAKQPQTKVRMCAKKKSSKTGCDHSKGGIMEVRRLFCEFVVLLEIHNSSAE